MTIQGRRRLSERVRPAVTAVSVVDTVHAQLRKEILEGVQPPGSSLSVSATSARLQVSAVPIREALRRLEGERLVRFEANIGAIVAPISRDDLRDVYETRRIVEAGAIRVAVETDSIDKGRLEKVFTKMSDAYHASDHVAAYSLHREFHEMIVATKTQPRLNAMAMSLLDASDRYLRLVPGLPSEAEVLVDIHGAIAHAILGSDAEAAYLASVRHMDYSLEHLDHRNFTHQFPPLG